jgi:hypothetical protein
MSQIDFDVRYWIAQCLAGEITLSEFRRLLLPVAWMSGEPGEPDSPLARRAELRLAEYSNGHWSEEELRVLLAGMTAQTTGLPAEIHMSAPRAGVNEPVRGPLRGDLVRVA